MAEGSSEATSDINIDTKRLSTAVIREALFRATGEEKWIVDDEWAYFLKQQFSVFNNIAKTNSSKNWEIPQIGREIDNAFKGQAKGRIPDWTEPIIEYSKTVEWIRRQYWKNNRNKGELALALDESTTGRSRVADDRPGVAPSIGKAGARDKGGNRAGAGALGYWSDILH
ncbi:hypothetical protein NA56DRAFT_647933 [Hyaloscypha hepaticicola]|uniref:Uncharacterized protein n=1 Tax=Hyaloscypha hepaticicola TaxID=2082293 RepID=A0A2J6PWT7_9HELO|nr:hypothetical protein NA56DRAFT_647933 [Hyaloscypha hepaticicola]